MKIIESITKEQILANYHIISQLYPVENYPHMERENYAQLIPEMQAQGYRQIAMVDEQGKTLGVAGFNETLRLYLGKIMRINDIVVDEKLRRRGIGKQLLDWILVEAKRHNCAAVVLDTGLPKKDSHRFYEREGFYLQAYHYVKKI